MKKTVLISFLILGFVFLSGCGKKKIETPPSQIIPTAVPTRPVEETIGERPYVSLLPSFDGHWLTLEIKNIIKGTTGLDYELTYFADVEGSKIERGVTTGGIPVELNGQSDFSKKLLLGSASCTTGTCKYKYDENVTEGMLTIKLIGSGAEKYESAFKIQKGKEAATGFSAGDGVFLLKSSGLSANSSYLIISSVGIPIQLSQGIIAKSVPYGFYPNTNTKGTVSFKTELTGINIYGLVGKTWQKLETTIEFGMATADFSNASLFILGQ